MPYNVINTALSLILIIAVPFLVAMIVVYALYSNERDISTRVCPDKHGKYTVQHLDELAKLSSYNDFVRDDCQSYSAWPNIAALVKKLQTSEKSTESYEYACAVFVHAPNSVVTSQKCLGIRDPEEIASIFHVSSNCDEWDSDKCLIHLIYNVQFHPRFEDSPAQLAALTVVAEVPTIYYNAVLLGERQCPKTDNDMLNCANLTDDILNVYYWPTGNDSDRMIVVDDIKVQATCSQAKADQMCFVYSDCEKIRSGVVVHKDGRFMGTIMQDVCTSTDEEETAPRPVKPPPAPTHPTPPPPAATPEPPPPPPTTAAATDATTTKHRKFIPADY